MSLNDVLSHLMDGDIGSFDPPMRHQMSYFLLCQPAELGESQLKRVANNRPGELQNFDAYPDG